MKFIKNLLLATTICASLSATALASTPFTDLGDWYDPYVETAFEAGCVSGRTADTFAPHGELAMSEFAVMLSKAYYGTELAEEMSKHEELEHWADNYINTLKNQYSETYGTTFSSIAGYDNMSRYEAAYVVGMMLEDKGIADFSLDYSDSLADFTDISIPDTETKLLAITSTFGIMNGKSETNFDGTGTLTRAEACVIISKLIELEKGSGLERDTFDQSNVVAKPVETPAPEETPTVTIYPPSTSTGGTINDTPERAATDALIKEYKLHSSFG